MWFVVLHVIGSPGFTKVSNYSLFLLFGLICGEYLQIWYKCQCVCMYVLLFINNKKHLSLIFVLVYVQIGFWYRDVYNAYILNLCFCSRISFTVTYFWKQNKESCDLSLKTNPASFLCIQVQDTSMVAFFICKL